MHTALVVQLLTAMRAAKCTKVISEHMLVVCHWGLEMHQTHLLYTRLSKDPLSLSHLQ